MGRVSQEVRERYNAKTYTQMKFRLRKDRDPGPEEIKARAASLGLSLNAYIVNLILKDMEKA